jgi:hypothetical protein
LGALATSRSGPDDRHGTNHEDQDDHDAQQRCEPGAAPAGAAPAASSRVTGRRYGARAKLELGDKHAAIGATCEVGVRRAISRDDAVIALAIHRRRPGRAARTRIDRGHRGMGG